MPMADGLFKAIFGKVVNTATSKIQRDRIDKLQHIVGNKLQSYNNRYMRFEDNGTRKDEETKVTHLTELNAYETRDILKELYENKVTEQEAQAFYDSIMLHPTDEITMPERFIGLQDNKEFQALLIYDIPLKTVAKWRYEGWPTNCALCGKECDVNDTRNCYMFHELSIKGEIKKDVMVHGDCNLNEFQFVQI